ncbi:MULTISPECIES: hypothetical protein [unclassified Lysobacter]|uniref:hypothetical protein n=1 Tax=unclassified Lysobacter TaxID=2635362 RepID=UPI0006F67F8A|nr:MULTISPECIES: hypothetical protein [unclassified Lysobacter]KQZ66540.1 hypothetical protein ASD53_15670 [Lysobacter sp. Root559]KRC32692.1 hypothetical protein ASE10_14035 [Lysobacter sp. Root76]KRD67964.1 hypothetical protein ASE45_14725 [Lysobacter sp. Root96]
MRKPFRRIAVLLLSLALAPQAFAAEDCQSRMYSLLTAAYPGAQGETGDNGEMLRLPGAEPRWINLGEVACKVWPASPDKTLIAVMLQHQNTFDDEGSADLELLVADSMHERIAQRYRENDALQSDAIRITGLALDTARYRLNESTTAFGVRVNSANGSRANPYSSTRLSLYVLDGVTIRPVLRDIEMDADNGEWDTRCDGEFHSSRSTLAVDGKRDHGYAGLILRTVDKSTRQSLKGDECAESVAESETRSERLSYDGREYSKPD